MGSIVNHGTVVKSHDLGIDGLVWERVNSIANALELCLSCICSDYALELFASAVPESLFQNAKCNSSNPIKPFVVALGQENVEIRCK